MNKKLIIAVIVALLAVLFFWKKKKTTTSTQGGITPDGAISPIDTTTTPTTTTGTTTGANGGGGGTNTTTNTTGNEKTVDTPTTVTEPSKESSDTTTGNTNGTNVTVVNNSPVQVDLHPDSANLVSPGPAKLVFYGYSDTVLFADIKVYGYGNTLILNSRINKPFNLVSVNMPESTTALIVKLTTTYTNGHSGDTSKTFAVTKKLVEVKSPYMVTNYNSQRYVEGDTAKFIVSNGMNVSYAEIKVTDYKNTPISTISVVSPSDIYSAPIPVGAGALKMTVTSTFKDGTSQTTNATFTVYPKSDNTAGNKDTYTYKECTLELVSSVVFSPGTANYKITRGENVVSAGLVITDNTGTIVFSKAYPAGTLSANWNQSVSVPKGVKTLSAKLTSFFSKDGLVGYSDVLTLVSVSNTNTDTSGQNSAEVITPVDGNKPVKVALTSGTPVYAPGTVKFGFSGYNANAAYADFLVKGYYGQTIVNKRIYPPFNAESVSLVIGTNNLVVQVRTFFKDGTNDLVQDSWGVAPATATNTGTTVTTGTETVATKPALNTDPDSYAGAHYNTTGGTTSTESNPDLIVQSGSTSGTTYTTTGSTAGATGTFTNDGKVLTGGVKQELTTN